MSSETGLGNFTNMAEHYHHRAGYSDLVLKAITALFDKPVSELRIADIGAGTGKLTTHLAALHPKSLIAVEPNDAMRAEGMNYTKGLKVVWLKGSGEVTNLPNNSIDWLIMGSSFHWVNLEKGLSEFHRVLAPSGLFTAIWNPRDLPSSLLQSEIDKQIKEMIPALKRVSSGAAGVTQDWANAIVSTKQFKDMIFMEAKHEEIMTPERYMGLWKSVNDIQTQAGPERWQEILGMISARIKGMETITMPYLSRAWTARRVDQG
ncbi:MAG: class I SAM-dependent methyltransferase [Candidatus Obscuribacterales bacterium]|nr:class I SAM-dependent methyltransferase [Candidatus Obscuribacterales bacterium]